MLILGEHGQAVRRYELDEPHSTFDEAAEALRHALCTAVERRVAAIPGVLSADFSGGLDSTTLVLLAARTGREVVALTRRDPASPNDDLVYAMAAAAADRRIRHLIIEEKDGALFFDRLGAVPVADQPFGDAARWSMRIAYQRHAVDLGSAGHVTGLGGDTLLTAPPTYLADIARAGQPAALWRHSLARARLRHLPVRTVMATAVRLARTTHRQALEDLADVVAAATYPRSGRKPLRWYTASAAASWLTHDTRDDLAMTIRQAAAAAHDDLPMSTRRAWYEIREFGTYQVELLAQITAAGLHPHAPFLDNEVVRACQSVPLHLRQHPYQFKPLLGAALRGLVPDFLLDRRTKGAYSGNAYTGAACNAPHLRLVITGSELVRHGLVDLSRVLDDLRSIVHGLPGPFAALEALLTTELWLTQLNTDPTIRDPKAHVLGSRWRQTADAR